MSTDDRRRSASSVGCPSVGPKRRRRPTRPPSAAMSPMSSTPEPPATLIAAASSVAATGPIRARSADRRRSMSRSRPSSKRTGRWRSRMLRGIGATAWKARPRSSSEKASVPDSERRPLAPDRSASIAPRARLPPRSRSAAPKFSRSPDSSTRVSSDSAPRSGTEDSPSHRAVRERDGVESLRRPDRRSGSPPAPSPEKPISPDGPDRTRRSGLVSPSKKGMGRSICPCTLANCPFQTKDPEEAGGRPRCRPSGSRDRRWTRASHARQVHEPLAQPQLVEALEAGEERAEGVAPVARQGGGCFGDGARQHRRCRALRTRGGGLGRAQLGAHQGHAADVGSAGEGVEKVEVRFQTVDVELERASVHHGQRAHVRQDDARARQEREPRRPRDGDRRPDEAAEARLDLGLGCGQGERKGREGRDEAAPQHERAEARHRKRPFSPARGAGPCPPGHEKTGRAMRSRTAFRVAESGGRSACRTKTGNTPCFASKCAGAKASARGCLPEACQSS